MPAGSEGGDAPPGDVDRRAKGDATAGGEETAGDRSALAGDASEAFGDSAAMFGDGRTAGDEAGDVTNSSAGDASPAIPSELYFAGSTADPPIALDVVETICITTSSVFTLVGPPTESWRVRPRDALDRELEPIPEMGEGDLVPLYLGGGEYTEAGFATVAGSGLPPSATRSVVNVGGAQWTVMNACATPLIAAREYPQGLSNGGTEVPSGSTVCPAVTPWVLGITVPSGAVYDVAIFDFDSGATSYESEATLPPSAGGVVELPPLPSFGRVQLALLNSNDEEVESVSVYLDCP